MRHFIFGTTALLAAISIGTAAMADETVGPESYDVSEVNIENFFGTINISVTSDDDVTVKVQGDEDHLDDLEVRVSGDRLYIGRDDWDDWDDRRHGWFDGLFNGGWNDDDRDLDDYPVADISVPEGIALDLEGIAGRLNIGDVNGPLELSGWWLNGSIGSVAEADISILGSGNLRISRVVGELELDVRGSGNVEVDQVGSAEIDSLGSGDVTIDTIDSDLEFSGKGSGDGNFGSVNGKVDISVLGSGDVDIKEGIANPLEVSIMGSADVSFGGTAHNTNISQMGSGRVRIAHDNWDD